MQKRKPATSARQREAALRRELYAKADGKVPCPECGRGVMVLSKRAARGDGAPAFECTACGTVRT